MIQAQPLVPLPPCVRIPIVTCRCRLHRAAGISERRLPVRRVRIPFNNRTSTICKCGDTVLPVAVVVENVVAAVDAGDDFVDVAGEYILVSGAGG